jgi:hypothetical protein
VWFERLGQLKKINDLMGIRNRDLPVCGTVPQPTINIYVYTYNKYETFLRSDINKRELIPIRES